VSVKINERSLGAEVSASRSVGAAMGHNVRFLPAGDTALVVEFGESIDRTVNDRVLRLHERVRLAGLPGVTETVPTFRSLLVHYDPLRTGFRELSRGLQGLLSEHAERTHGARRWSVPVCYEPPFAPDLPEVAERTGLAPDEVVELHASVAYHVYMLGFLPGYPYMGDLPETLVLPRRENPRVRVPPGSVAIATTLTAIYSLESPGGWHLIGATPARTFDPAWDPPVLFAPGDTVTFTPVGRETFERIRTEATAGRYRVPCQESAP
jgi:inhibitor of KinA